MLPDPDKGGRDPDRGGVAAAARAWLERTARGLRNLYGAIAAYLSVSFLVALIGLLGFLWFVDEVLEGETRAFDEWALRWAAELRSDTLDHLVLEVTALGNNLTLAVLVLITSIFLWQARRRYSVLLLLTALAGGALVNYLLKGFFDRPRPVIVETVSDVLTASFPSGHAMGSLIVYGSVAYLVARLEGSRRLRRLTYAMAALIILAVGLSRVYLGVHYPSDVLAGYIAGLTWLGFVISGIAAARFLWSRRVVDRAEMPPPEVRDEPVR